MLLLLLLLAPVLLACQPTAAAAATADSSNDKGQLEQEASRLRAAVNTRPSDSLLQLQLATVLHKLNHISPDGGSRVPEAAAAYRAALAALQGSNRDLSLPVVIRGNLAALLLAGDMPQDAITELRAALAAADAAQMPTPERGGLLFNLGKALTTVGELQEADDTYAAAAAAAARHDLGSYSKALAAARSLAPEAAEEASQVAAAARRVFGKQAALAFLKDARGLPRGSAGKLKKSELQWIKKADSMDLVWLHFALYKHHHGKKEYEVAWPYLELGNKIMAAHLAYSPQLDRHNLRHIKEIFRTPFLTGGSQDETPIFVVGMPRSGSTLVEQMLASHSQVFAAGEDTALAPLTAQVNQQLSQPAADHSRIVKTLGERYVSLMRQRVPPPPPAAAAAGDPSSSSSGRTESAAAKRADASSKPSGEPWPRRIVDKMLRNLWLIGYIQMLLPKACIIHVARHPLDVALSCYAQPFGYSASSLAWAWDLEDIATQLEMSWDLAQHWEQQLPGRVHTVLYEDLVAHPEQVARRLLAACGLEWEPSVLRFQQTQRPVHTASMVQVRQPLYSSSVGRWQAYAGHLAGLQQRLAPLIARYEQLLQQHMAAHELDDGEQQQVPSSGEDAAAGAAAAEASGVPAAGGAHEEL